jgi:HEAT repeat protein
MQPDPTLQDYIEQLRDPNPAMRITAVYAIRQLRDPDAIGPLVWLMADDSLWVRCTAAESLGEFHSLDVVEPLIQFLKLGAEAELAEVGIPAEVPLRYHAFARYQDEDFEQWRTAQGIGSQHEGFSLVVSAKIGLQMTGIDATEALIALLDDDNPYLQYVAVGLLNHIAIRKRPSDALLLGTLDDNPIIRMNSARALGKLGNLRAVRPLINLLRDENTDVRAAAAVALGEVRDTRAIPALQATLEDPYVQDAAWLALQQLEGSPDEDDTAPTTTSPEAE